MLHPDGAGAGQVDLVGAHRGEDHHLPPGSCDGHVEPSLATVINVKRSAPRPPGAKMAVNSRGETIIVDMHNHRVQIFSAGGRFLRKFGSEGSGNGEFSCPWGVCVTADDDTPAAAARSFFRMRVPSSPSRWATAKFRRSMKVAMFSI